MDADDIAAWIYSRARVDEEDPPGPVALARRIVSVVRSDTHGPHGAKLDEGVIHVGRRLEGSALTWLVAHELAELALRVTDYRGEDIERLADSGAAAIIMPRPAFVKHARHLSISDMAKLYGVSCTAASLRYGEVTRRPVAVVAPTHVHIRGEDWEWGDLPGLAKAKAPPEGVDRARLFDAVKRVRLIVRLLALPSDVVARLARTFAGDDEVIGASRGRASWRAGDADRLLRLPASVVCRAFHGESALAPVRRAVRRRLVARLPGRWRLPLRLPVVAVEHGDVGNRTTSTRKTLLVVNDVRPAQRRASLFSRRRRLRAADEEHRESESEDEGAHRANVRTRSPCSG